MRNRLVLSTVTTILSYAVLLLPNSVTAQNMSSPDAANSNKTNNSTILTNLTDTSANGNVSQNIRDVYNTTQSNNATMSNGR